MYAFMYYVFTYMSCMCVVFLLWCMDFACMQCHNGVCVCVCVCVCVHVQMVLAGAFVGFFCNVLC